jgi:hypothetical protein
MPKDFVHDPIGCNLCGHSIWNGEVYPIDWGDPDTHFCESCVGKIKRLRHYCDSITVTVSKERAIELNKRMGIL